MLDVTLLPAVNATLNGTAAVLLIAGYVQIRRKQIDAHRKCMLAAFTTSALFLVSYLIYHALVGSVAFTGQGPIRTLYFTVLISHVSLAILILPLALVTLRRGLRRDDARHVALARWTLPIWRYGSVT